MTFKMVTDENSISGTKEVGLMINDISSAKVFLEQIGLCQKSYEENLREEWKIGEVLFDIDTWPLINPFLEIEAPTEEKVREYFKKLDLNYSKAIFGSADVIYRKIYGIDILNRSSLTFKDKKIAPAFLPLAILVIIKYYYDLG